MSEEAPLVGSTESDTGGDTHPLLWFVFHGVRLAAVAVSAAMMVAQVLTLLVLDESLLQEVLRIYMIAFCACFILAELNLFQQRIPQFVGWIQRGIMYSFVGVIGVEEANTVRISKSKRTHRVAETPIGKLSGSYVWIVSVVMFLVGLAYICMGAMCLRRVYDRMHGRTTNGGGARGEQ